MNYIEFLFLFYLHVISRWINNLHKSIKQFVTSFAGDWNVDSIVLHSQIRSPDVEKFA